MKLFHIANRRRPMPTLLTVLAALALPWLAHAMDADIGIECAQCRYPTAVRMPLCSGVYMGKGLVITAAHCIDDVNEGVSKAKFGEDDSDSAYEFTIEYCETHPDGEPDTNVWGNEFWSGPDIAYCVLEDAAENTLPALPIVPPFIPRGCERNWLAHRVYESGSKPFVTVVGSGCDLGGTGWGEDCGDGIKRFAGRVLQRQTSYAGSSTKLQLHRDAWGDSDTGLRSGDSGGPVFIKMPAPDNSWRLLAVNSVSAIDDYAEAVPPYLHWIEAASGIDITPHHKYVNGNWGVDPLYPTALLPRYEHDADWYVWPYQCSLAPRGYSDSYTAWLCDDDGWSFGASDFAAQPSAVPQAAPVNGSTTLIAGLGSSAAPLSFLPLEEDPRLVVRRTRFDAHVSTFNTLQADRMLAVEGRAATATFSRPFTTGQPRPRDAR